MRIDPRRYEVILVALAACGEPAAVKTPPTNVVVGPPISHAPFVIGSKIVAEDGHVVRDIPGGGTIATPIGPHRFALEDGRVVDTEADTIEKKFPDAAWEGDKVTRYEPDGRVRWQQDVAGVHGVRPPDIVVAGNRTVASVVGGVHAFDDATGQPVWSSTTTEGLTLATLGHALLSVSCNEPTHEHALVANDLATGSELWRAQLVDGCDPRVATTDRYVLAVEEGKTNETRVFDATGRLVLHIPEQTLGGSGFAWGSAHALGGDTLIVTDKHMLRFDSSGHIVWQKPTLAETFVGADEFAELPGGDLLIANYGAISDSGVDLVRVRASDGEIVWHVKADPLGVAHSEYYHRAYVDVRGDVFYVVSQGSYGAFLEKRSVASGALQARHVRP